MARIASAPSERAEDPSPIHSPYASITYSVPGAHAPLCVAVPVGVAIVLNAIVRPWLAESLNGARRTSFTNAKSADGWWEFSDPVRTAHPAATSLLETSDGAIATAGIALAALVCGALLAGDSLRGTEERKRG